MDYFWNFPFDILDPSLPRVTEIMEHEAVDKVRTTAVYFRN